jgi:putative flippase GtrA
MALSRPAYRHQFGRAKRKPTMIPAPLQNILNRLTVAWHERAIALKAVSFGLVGIVNSAIDFGVFSFCYYYIGLPLIVANTLAWLVAVTGSYAMNSTITFAAESGRHLGVKSYFAFAASQVAGFLGNTITVWCLVTLLLIPAWAAKVAAILVSFVINFSLSHFVVFKQRRPPSDAHS